MHRCFFYIKKNQVNSENHSILLEKEGWQWQVDKKKKDFHVTLYLFMDFQE
jgi:hypothetical protein